jgi:peptidylprolyl isomerase
MPKCKIGILILAGLFVGGCFTPAEYKEAEEQSTEDEGDEAVTGPVTVAERGKRGAPDAAASAEAPTPGVEGEITYAAPYDGEPLSKEDLGAGLIVEDFVIGKGDPVVDGGMITVHYTGYLRSGPTFDDSTERGVPASFTIGKGGVIKGWDEGMKGMKVGGKRRIHVPAAQGYGVRGRGKIPPNADLIFTVELLAVTGPPKGEDGFSGKGQSTNKRADGLEITTYAKGKGPKADMGDEVHVHYIGKLEDGTVFDSSHKRGQPIRMALGKGVKGWNEGIKGMQAGGRRKLVVPPELGYGDKDMKAIPPNSTLTFMVELMVVNKRPKPGK